MSNGLRNARGRRVAIWMAASLGFCGAAAWGWAQEPDKPGDARYPVLGCGKAQALALRYLAEQADGGDVSLREAMTETDVLHYDLDIEISNLVPDPNNGTCTITGTNVMTIQSKAAALTEFTFRLRNQYTITSATVNGTTPVTVAEVSSTTRRATLDRTYSLDEVFTLTISYTGNSVKRGFGSIDVDTQYDIPVVATLSEPYYAYTWWPAKDGDVYVPGDNSDKATLEFSITAPNDFVVPSNGTLLSVETLSGNRKRYNWATDYPITTYLVSFAATNYNTWTQTYSYSGGTMPVEFYIYPGNDNPSNRAEWEKVMNMLPVFGDLFGEYPFIEEKYGIYNFNFGGGMEHQTITGLGTFDESVNAHELAHQWWGDMITCRTWNHIWLNEGFATYGAGLWEEFKPGSTGLPALKSYMAARKYTNLGSVYVSDAETASMYDIFDGNTSYNKGGWVLHMLRHVLGDADFFDALAVYRAAFAYGAATTEDFQAVCENFYPTADLNWFFQEWVYGEYAPA
ncbi:MAG: M1 family metallopeptidase [Planctomycetota bacterium]